MHEGHITPKGKQSHKVFFRVGTLHDEFGGGVSVYGIVNLVLHLLEKLLRHRCTRVIVNARGVDFQHLPIEHLLCGANIADIP